jgi:hypothetical protein
MGILFRQLFDLTSSTYTYLLADEATREALLIEKAGVPDVANVAGGMLRWRVLEL